MNTMISRIKAMCKDRGTNITALCLKVTGSSGNLATWNKGYMRSDSLAKVAVELGVSTDYLLFGTNHGTNISGNNVGSNAILAVSSSNISVGTQFTQQEVELIDLYRKASLKTQMQVINMLTKNN